MKLKASYTVEAAVVISLSFIIFGIAMAIAYELFKSTIDYVGQEGTSFDAVARFRLKESVMGVINSLRN